MLGSENESNTTRNYAILKTSLAAWIVGCTYYSIQKGHA